MKKNEINLSTMKKLYKKGQVHPSPPSVAEHLAVLPAAILTLTAALSAEDKEVLAYLLLSCSDPSSNFSGHPNTISNTKNGGDAEHSGGRGDHSPMFECNCFRCYMCFWARWDASPSRELIHEIIEAYEEDQLVKKKKRRSSKVKKEKRKKTCAAELKGGEDGSGETSGTGDELGESIYVDVSGSTDGVMVGGDGMKVGSVTRIASFIGERIWGIWNRF